MHQTCEAHKSPTNSLSPCLCQPPCQRTFELVLNSHPLLRKHTCKELTLLCYKGLQIASGALKPIFTKVDVVFVSSSKAEELGNMSTYWRRHGLSFWSPACWEVFQPVHGLRHEALGNNWRGLSHRILASSSNWFHDSDASSPLGWRIPILPTNPTLASWLQGKISSPNVPQIWCHGFLKNKTL